MRALVLAIVFLLTLEATCRIEDWLRYGTPLFSAVRSEDDLLVRDAAGEHGRPHAQFQKWALNNLGMRGPDAPATKPPNTLRVVPAGASETLGLYESPNHEFPRQLEDSLRRCDSTVRVLNAAIFGMSLPTVDQDIRTRVAPLHPDIVVLYPTPVQYLSPERPRAATPDSTGSTPPLHSAAAFYPRALDRLRDALKQMTPAWLATLLRRRLIAADTRREPPGWRFTTIPSDRLADYDADLRHTIGSIRAIGATPVLMTHVNAFMAGANDQVRLTEWEHQYPRATGAVLIAFDSAAAITTARAAADSSAPLVDLATLARDHHLPPPQQAFGDYAHFTDAGSAAVAGALAHALLADTTTWRHSCIGQP
jgi:hypothetical protein